LAVAPVRFHAELDKLAHSANLTEQQKKAVDDKVEQVKRAIAAAAAKPPA
jgi:hypothetical protein